MIKNKTCLFFMSLIGIFLFPFFLQAAAISHGSPSIKIPNTLITPKVIMPEEPPSSTPDCLTTFVGEAEECLPSERAQITTDCATGASACTEYTHSELNCYRCPLTKNFLYTLSCKPGYERSSLGPEGFSCSSTCYQDCVRRATEALSSATNDKERTAAYNLRNSCDDGTECPFVSGASSFCPSDYTEISRSVSGYDCAFSPSLREVCGRRGTLFVGMSADVSHIVCGSERETSRTLPRTP